MNDFSRWMRYMLPGSVVSLHFLIVLYVMHHEKLKSFIETFKNTDTEISSLAALLLGTGALGFVFSTVYYTFRNWKWTMLFYDHGNILFDLRNNYKVEYIFVGETAERMAHLCERQQIDNLNIRQRWELFNIIWHTEKNKSSAMRNVEKVAHKMHDVAHGIGATLFGLLISSIGYMWIDGTFKWPGWIILFWIIPMVCARIAYRNVNNSVGKIYDDSLQLYFADAISFCHTRRYFSR